MRTAPAPMTTAAWARRRRVSPNWSAAPAPACGAAAPPSQAPARFAICLMKTLEQEWPEMSWNPETHGDYDDLRGCAVYTADNVRVGTIMHVFHPNDEPAEQRGGHYFLI